MKMLRGGVCGSLFMACVAMAANPASAADLGGGPRPYAEPLPEMPFTSVWQGLYGGVHLGYGDAWNGDGIIGGGQIGYNWQADRLVIGAEADISLSDIDGHGTSVDWLGSARGRIGFLLDPRLLAYATAGVGFADIDDLGGSDTETDFVYGLGLEGKLNERMTARLEYLAYDDLDIDVVRAGLNFKLGY